MLNAESQYDSQAEERRAFLEAHEQVKQQIRNMGRTTISPQSKFLAYWDVATAFALLWTAFVTPFEVGFLSSGEEEFTSALFIINRTVDSVFICDMFMSFFLPYRTAPARGGMWVYDNRKIAINYLTSWFPLDLLTGIPFDFVISTIIAGNSSNDDAPNAAFSSSMLQLLRVMRIAKLARILRASRIYKRWIDYIGMSYASQALLRFLILTCVLAHWLACLWGFTGQRADLAAAETWHSRLPKAYDGFKLGEEQYNHPFEIYGACLYVALNNIFGGSCEINPNSAAEYYVQGLMMLCGSCVWAYVIGSCCGILATLNPALIEYRQTMDELNVFVKDHDLPQDLTVRLRSYFRNTMHLIRTRRYEQLLAKMSKRLRGDASLIVATRAFKRVSYLRHPDIEPEFLCHLTIRFKLAVYSRLERISTQSLFIVDRGVCAKKGKIALIGACLGQDMIVSNEMLRDTSDAVALTFVQTVFLTKDAIFELLPEFPGAYKVIRKAAYKMALCRFIVKAAEAGTAVADKSFKGGSPSVLARANVSSPGAAAKCRWGSCRSAQRVMGMGDKQSQSSSPSRQAEERPKVSVGEAISALNAKHVADSLVKAAAAKETASAFGGISLDLYGNADQMSEMKEQMETQMAAMSAEVGGVNAKLDAMQQQISALVKGLTTSQKLRPARSRAGSALKPPVAKAPGENGVIVPQNGSANAAANPSDAARAAEIEEMRSASIGPSGAPEQAATKSSPYDA